MSEPEVQDPKPDPPVFWDAPNQQVVREDESPPWEEGTGGDGGEAAAAEKPLDAMTKAELLEYAAAHDVHVTSEMTKDEIRAAIG